MHLVLTFPGGMEWIILLFALSIVIAPIIALIVLAKRRKQQREKFKI